MDTVERYSQIVRNLITDYAGIPARNGEVEDKAFFDEANGRYLLMAVGWEGSERVHAVVFHIDIVGDKIWLQRNHTNRDIAQELVDAGIPRENIVIGYRHPELRTYSGYAVN